MTYCRVGNCVQAEHADGLCWDHGRDKVPGDTAEAALVRSLVHEERHLAVVHKATRVSRYKASAAACAATTFGTLALALGGGVLGVIAVVAAVGGIYSVIRANEES